MEEVGDLSNGDIAWFTVDFQEVDDGRRFKLVRDSVHITTLERATEGLTGGSPVTLTEFERRYTNPNWEVKVISPYLISMRRCGPSPLQRPNKTCASLATIGRLA